MSRKNRRRQLYDARPRGVRDLEKIVDNEIKSLQMCECFYAITCTVGRGRTSRRDYAVMESCRCPKRRRRVPMLRARKSVRCARVCAMAAGDAEKSRKTRGRYYSYFTMI